MLKLVIIAACSWYSPHIWISRKKKKKSLTKASNQFPLKGTGEVAQYQVSFLSHTNEITADVIGILSRSGYVQTPVFGFL